jgi:hypothetical protein
MPVDITFDTLLTAAGAGIAGGIITALVELIKGVLRTTGREINGAVLAFVLSAILYIIALFATDSLDFDPGLQVFLAWLTCAVASVGIYTSIRQVKPVS